MAAPKTIAELYKFVVGMKDDFEKRIKQLEDSNQKLRDEVTTKDEEIERLKAAETQNKEVQKQQQDMLKVVENHQNFLEKSDTFRRECNVVVYGLAESNEVTDNDKIKEVLQAIGCQETVPEKCQRLGTAPEPPAPDVNEEERPRRPRPLLLMYKSRGEKSAILSKANLLKNSEQFKKVFIKKDQTPHERKEWSRLRDALKREKARPENAGMNVKINYKEKTVTVGDRVVEKGNFRRGPEW